MKKIATSDITTTAGLPIKSGTLDHLQASYQDILAAICRNLVGAEFDPGTIYVLYGCVNSGSGSSFVISAGAVFFNGEVYLVDAVSFVTSGGNVPTGILSETVVLAANADPVQFTDGSSHNVHVNIQFAIIAAASGTGIDFSNWVYVNTVKMQRLLVAAFSSGYTVNFKQDKSIFFTAGLTSGGGTISWDFVGAIPGTIVKLKLAMAAATTLAFATPGGSTIVALAGSGTASKTNYIDIEYVGKNEGGNDEVRYGVISI